MTKYMTRIGLLFGAALALLSAAPAIASDGTRYADEASWTFHSAFYNQPRRIIDTPTRVYFFVHTHTYSATKYASYYKVPAGTIFYLDKSAPEAGLQDMAREVRFSGFDMRLVEVDPKRGVMAVAYLDGGIDVISPDGNVRYIPTLKDSRNYRHAVISSIRFADDSGDLQVSTDGGLAVFDGASLASKSLANWTEALADIAPAGDIWFAIINSEIYSAPAESDLTLRSNYTKVANVTAHTPVRLMPIDGTYCAFSGDNGYIHLMTRGKNNTWSRKQLVGDGQVPLAADQKVISRMDHNIHPYGSGYAVIGKTKVYLIDFPQEEGKAPEVRTVNRPDNTNYFGATCDAKNFWFYQEPGMFVRATLGDGNTLSASSAPFRASAPHTSKDAVFMYSPTRGFLMTNSFNDLKCTAYDQIMPLTIARYKDGKWTDLSPRREIPYFAEEDADALAKYNANKWYPVNEPHGAMVDPLNPDILIGASPWHSLAMTYLDDPRRKPLVYTYKDGPYASTFGAVEVFPKSTWANYVGLRMMGADGDGTIWATRSNLFPADGSSDYLAQVWALTAEARKSAIESGDVSASGAWKRMEVDTKIWPEFYVNGKALKHPKNKNKLVLSSQGGNGFCRPLRIYDHNGTLDDSSDDTVTLICYLKTDSGRIYTADYTYCVYEDEITGDVYVGLYNDMYILDLTRPVENMTIEARTLSLASEGDRSLPIFTPAKVYGICSDEYGRLWFATSYFGVFGISPDRKKLVAHYTAENSPLPSNDVYAIGWNPDTKSLFMSTGEIVAEVKVDADDSGAEAPQGAPFLSRTVVTPDFAGTVAIYNLPRGVALNVRDSDNRTVAAIGASEDGTAHWNLLDTEGNRVPSGRYTIVEATATGISGFAPLDLQVIR